jgi:hypothetical protein
MWSAVNVAHFDAAELLKVSRTVHWVLDWVSS